MNDKNFQKKTKLNKIKTRTKAKLNTEVFEEGQKVRISNYTRTLDDSIFVKFQPIYKYSKKWKSNCGQTKTNCI